MLYAAANTMVTMAGSQIKFHGLGWMRIKGRRRALVAVARKLVVLLHRMGLDGTELYQGKARGRA